MITIAEVMTKSPKLISPKLSLTEASRLMNKDGIRHLPVVDFKGNIVGILSERDIRLASTFPKSAVSTVDDVMAPYPYVVQKEELLPKVLREMRSQKYGAAIVVDDIGQVCGIFTVTDALAMLGNLTKGA